MTGRTGFRRTIAACVLAGSLSCGGCKSSGARATRDAAPTPTTPTTPAAPRVPRCAVQDCKTGNIVDDGCVDDGKGGRLCAACVNVCAPPP